MCTLIALFKPKESLLIGSNRDENPTRPADGWKLRGNIYCPLDVRGGTWIGANTNKIFCAITNWRDVIDVRLHGLKSRGQIVLDLLSYTSTNNGLTYFCESIKPKDYKTFNIIYGDINNLYNISNDHSQVCITKLDKGVHISTGWGFNTNCKRERSIRKMAVKYNIQTILKSHEYGIGSEDSVCVHDAEHKWETISSAVIMLNSSSMKINVLNGSPCSTIWGWAI